MRYLFDSSAWLVHLFGESGVEEVNQLFDDSAFDIVISVLSIPEVYARLLAIGKEQHWQEIWDTYSLLFTNVISVDESIAFQANILRSNTPRRLPTIDGLIAATAVVHGCALVHRDPHMAAIPSEILKQIHLPNK
jgi:predicted nucleic acid-binding protein